eukprot:360158-Chlamydomonas_euryale.AAC.2
MLEMHLQWASDAVVGHGSALEASTGSAAQTSACFFGGVDGWSSAPRGVGFAHSIGGAAGASRVAPTGRWRR